MNVSSVESRLRALEEMLRGGSSAEVEGPASRIRSLESKLDALAMDAAQQGGPNLKQLWEESDKLMLELNPGSALTHQQQIAAPILYRRQEVLACSESLHRNMQQVMEILTLLSIGQPQMIGDSPVSEMQVTKAPILTQTTPPSKEDQERLRKVEKTMSDVSQQMESMAARMDRLVAGYHSLVSVVSEKMVLADEVMTSKKS